MDNQDWERQLKVIKQERIWQKEQEKYNKEKDESQEEYARHDALEKATAGLTIEELERLTPDLCRQAPKLQEALDEIRGNTTEHNIHEIANEALAEGGK